jgi:two-component system sensor histidine kinase SenX3
VRTIVGVGTGLLLLVGALGGALAVLLTLRLRTFSTAEPPAQATETGNTAVPDAVTDVLAVLRWAVVLVDADDVVVEASAPAVGMQLVRGDRLSHAELADLVRKVRRDGSIRERELALQGGRWAPERHITVRVAPLSSSLVLLLAEDRTREHRVDAVRRDFAINVSHELKTPVGALTLLAEAVAEAADDPEAVQRFSRRMRVEADRLGRLVQQVIELSRLQDDDLVDEPQRVDVDTLVATALDRTRIDAETRRVSLVGQTDTGLQSRGSAGQLQVALGNLVDNAVVYSPGDTKVSITAKRVADNVHITVSDQGVGIAENELERIFERFYRVDPARARSTGGTGLGLSIVKHVAASHGGEVRVWSVEKTGSSFTLVLPAWSDEPRPERPGVTDSEITVDQARPAEPVAEPADPGGSHLQEAPS